jgi:hypothetical protein
LHRTREQSIGVPSDPNSPATALLEQSIMDSSLIHADEWQRSQLPEVQAAYVPTCSASFKKPMGQFVLGFTYNRSVLIESVVNSKVKAGLLARITNGIVGNSWLAENFGTDHKGILAMFKDKATSKAKIMGEKNWVDLGLTRTAAHYEGDEVGHVLLEFTLCRITDEERLFKCRIAKGSATLREKGKLYSIARYTWKLGLSSFKFHFKKLFMSTLEERLPQKVMASLQKKGIAGVNVCVFDGQLAKKGDKKLIRQLRECKQVVVKEKKEKKIAKPTAFDDYCNNKASTEGEAADDSSNSNGTLAENVRSGLEPLEQGAVVTRHEGTYQCTAAGDIKVGMCVAMNTHMWPRPKNYKVGYCVSIDEGQANCAVKRPEKEDMRDRCGNLLCFTEASCPRGCNWDRPSNTCVYGGV